MACRCLVIIDSLLDFAWPRPAFLPGPPWWTEQAPLLSQFYTRNSSGLEDQDLSVMVGRTRIVASAM
jgi:hypothetical protein